jgi:hypothetical protein
MNAWAGPTWKTTASSGSFDLWPHSGPVRLRPQRVRYAQVEALVAKRPVRHPRPDRVGATSARGPCARARGEGADIFARDLADGRRPDVVDDVDPQLRLRLAFRSTLDRHLFADLPGAAPASARVRRSGCFLAWTKPTPRWTCRPPSRHFAIQVSPSGPARLTSVRLPYRRRDGSARRSDKWPCA